jgi:hypothetical protein
MIFFKKTIKPILLILLLTGFGSCSEVEPDIPPMAAISSDSIVTLGELRGMIEPGETERFTESGKQLFAVVTMDEKNGNIYRQAYIEDTTGGVNLRMNISADISEGDSIRIALKGSILSYFNNMLQLDSVDGPARIVIQEKGVHKEPEVVTISQILAGNHQARLVKLENVQFLETEIGETWADGFNLLTLNRTLQDCSNNTIIVRTSGYADFANDTLPNGNGTFIGIVTQFRDTWQLIVRDPIELAMNNQRCQIAETGVKVFEENFDSDLGSFTDYNIIGAQTWGHVTFDDGSAYINGFAGGAVANQDWLVSPQIDLTNYQNAILQIREAINFISSYDDLEVLIATDYEGGDPTSTGTWTNITNFSRPAGNNWTYLNSNDIDISQFDGSSIHLALKYTSNTSSASGWQISRVSIFADEVLTNTK